MQWAASIAIGVSTLATGGCGLPSFACDDAEQCTLIGGGVCQADGRCSYPDATCPSGQRYSGHAGGRAGDCVDGGGETDGSTATATATGQPDQTSTSDPGTTLDPADPCAAVDCGEHGECEADDQTPACVCDRGWVDRELQCVEQGCPGTRCLWVDQRRGDDANVGTMDAPIRSLARAAELAPALAPGEGIVLRRGQTWAEPWVLTGLAGTERAPIIVAAFGDPTADLPSIEGGVRLEDSTGVRLSQLRVTNPGGTAMRLEQVHHVTVHDCEAFEASSGCILVRAGSEYTALVDNDAWACGSTYGIGLVSQGGAPGDHHWLLDNRVDGEGTISAVQVAASAVDDVKVMRNDLRGSIDRGLHSRIGGHAWLVGNVIAQAGDFNDAALDHGGGGEVIARGNVILDAGLPVFLAGRGEWAFNTVLHQDPAAAITIPATAVGWSIHDNLVAAGDTVALLADMPTQVTTAHNVYVRGPMGDCAFEAAGMALDLPGWQGLGQGVDSRCEAVPGLEIPAKIGSTQTWEDDGLLDGATPDAGWDGCGDPVGALGCDGQPLAASLPAFEGYGHGWLGPAVVQERVEFAP